MTWIEAFILGAIQGLSEFLPISSSAHLVITKHLFQIQIDHSQLEFEILLHLASLLAVVIYFRRDLMSLIKGFILYLVKRKEEDFQAYRFCWFIIIATIVTGVIGKGMQNLIGDFLTNGATIGVALIITGIFLILIEHGITPGKRTENEMKWKDAIIVGLGQALAILPGISRAGSTLVSALWSGLSKETAVRYSFLLSIPLLLVFPFSNYHQCLSTILMNIFWLQLLLFSPVFSLH